MRNSSLRWFEVLIEIPQSAMTDLVAMVVVRRRRRRAVARGRQRTGEMAGTMMSE